MTLMPNLVLAEGTIQLYHSENIDNTHIYTIEAQNISQPIIGISATINLEPGAKFLKYEPGSFFENHTKEQTTYLIAPKKSNPNQIIIGIANLGHTISTGSGVIAKLFISSSNKAGAIKSVNEIITSGIKDAKRIDYPDIQWEIIPHKLPHSGSNLYFIGLASILITVCISIFLKVTK
jgi:hypothetical protein